MAEKKEDPGARNGATGATQDSLRCGDPDAGKVRACGFDLQAGSVRKRRLSETADDYPHVIARLGDGWRVVECAGAVQWILQKRDAGKAPSTGWRGVGYCVTREALLRLCGGLESPIDPSATAVLDRLPSCIRGASP